MARHLFSAFAVLAASATLSFQRPSQDARPPLIPLPEHPRPDFHREEWLNLNGAWQFQFDAPDAGETQGWFQSGLPAARPIIVPFPWGSPLSGVPDSAPIGWYARTIEVPAAWTPGARRVFLVIGAADWRTTAWLDGQKLGTHDGGYVPFEFELTRSMTRRVRSSWKASKATATPAASGRRRTSKRVAPCLCACSTSRRTSIGSGSWWPSGSSRRHPESSL